MRFPSGVHPRTLSCAGCHVSRLGTPPTEGMTNTSTLPSYSPLKAISDPSGEKTGLFSAPAPTVSLLASPPSRPTLHRSPAYTKTMCVRLNVGFWDRINELALSSARQSPQLRMKKRVRVMMVSFSKNSMREEGTQ